MAWEVGLITADPDALRAKAAAQPHDPAFRPFAERALAAGIPVEVVSDGFGFFIEPALEALGVGWLPVVTAATTFGPDGARIDFPNGNPDCFLCGTCKRNRVLAHQAAGRAVAFIGDGPSDRYAAGYSDVVFAKESLEQICIAEGWPFTRWTAFSEIDAWLQRTLAAFAADPAVAARPASPTPVLRRRGLGARPVRSRPARGLTSGAVQSHHPRAQSGRLKIRSTSFRHVLPKSSDASQRPTMRSRSTVAMKRWWKPGSSRTSVHWPCSKVMSKTRRTLRSSW